MERPAVIERLALMVDAMADGVVLADLRSGEVLINAAARTLLGIAPEDVVTTQFLKDRTGFYPFDLVTAHRRDGAPAESLREELRVGERLLHSVISPVHDDAGELVGVVVVLRELAELNDRNRRQREFVTMVSHELRTPLTSIAGALDIVLSGFSGPVSEKQQRYLDMARQAAARINVLLDDIVEISKQARDEGTGPATMRMTPLYLDRLGHDTAARYRDAALTKNITLSMHSEDHDIRIVGDADRLTQVINNLLSNAIKFTPVGGVIEFEVFGPSVAADHVGVSVFNNGEPVPEAERAHLFDSFDELDVLRARKIGGTGLGLGISRSIIEAHGGKIWFESDAGGTRFVFTLPSAPAASAAETDASTSPRDRKRRRNTEHSARVLLVDDDARSSYILKGILMVAGHDVLIAENVEQALALARAERPAVAVVSATMLGGDGLALLSIFRHDPDTRKTAILAIAPEAQREAALRAGAAEVLERPIQPAALREAIARLSAEAGRAHASRILVVDDDSSIRMICREMLEQAGYVVREAGDGEAALVEARRFRPDLVLVDVMMPGTDGFRLAERLHGESVTALCPLIFLSAKGDTADKVRAFRTGAEDYITKPFDAAELVARVGKALARQARELGASPTTQLPGADAIEAEIERRLAAQSGEACCYLDLDNLKAFNDYYGYAKADAIIRQTGDLIRDAIASAGGPGDFIGHIAGDDFVFITGHDRVDVVCKSIGTAFDRLIPLYYDHADRSRGFIETVDRYGSLRRFPLMTVSIAAVGLGGVASFSELASAAARGKKLAKAVSGSSYVRDGEVVVGHPPDTTRAFEEAETG